MDQIRIGAFLKALRKEKGLTQEQLAEKLAVSDRTVSRWETGSNMPDIGMLVVLADFYGVSIPELINGERKSENMNQETRDTAIAMAEYSQVTAKSSRRKVIGILFITFGLFIIISALSIFPSESSWGSIYATLGSIILIAGIYLIIRQLVAKRAVRLSLVFGCAVLLFEKRVLYVSAHLFQVQYTDSVRNNTTNDFINFYQTIDVLIIDDIQEFAGVTKTQNNFFHIFNHLHQNGKQLILTSDRAPVLLQGIEERLLTRFKWGMVAELEKPTVELRKNILRNKIHRDGLQFPPEVIDYIAENVNESVRDLEGIVIAIMARSTIFNKEIDLDLAQHIVHGVVHNETKAVTIDDILKVVCKHFDLEPSAIHTKSRKREVVQARQIAMYLAKNHTDFSTSKIGKFIGNKDHATVLHACKTVKGQLEVDKSFHAEVQEIESLLKKRN